MTSRAIPESTVSLQGMQPLYSHIFRWARLWLVQTGTLSQCWLNRPMLKKDYSKVMIWQWIFLSRYTRFCLLCEQKGIRKNIQADEAAERSHTTSRRPCWCAQGVSRLYEMIRMQKFSMACSAALIRPTWKKLDCIGARNWSLILFSLISIFKNRCLFVLCFKNKIFIAPLRFKTDISSIFLCAQFRSLFKTSSGFF